MSSVKLILAETELTDPVITAYITAASTWLDTLFVNTAMSETLAEELERWLAAHLIVSTQDRIATKEGAGGAFIEYTGTFGEGLKSTPYGQMAIALDTTGMLAAAGLKAVKVTAVKS